MESTYEELEATVTDVETKANLWQGRKEWQEQEQAWGDLLFEEVDVPLMEETVQKYWKSVSKAERGLPPNKLVPDQKDKVDHFRGTIPVIASLRNENLQERHWGKIQEIIGQEIVRDETFTLKKLIDMKVMDFAEEIAVVSTEATQEGVLEVCVGFPPDYPMLTLARASERRRSLSLLAVNGDTRTLLKPNLT